MIGRWKRRRDEVIGERPGKDSANTLSRPRRVRNAPAFLAAVAGVFVCAAVFAQTIPPSPYWKNDIEPPYDPFFAFASVYDEPRWVKFTVLLPPYDPSVVYYQDSRYYPFHYEFAADLLDPFKGMTRAQFDQATLYAAGQRAVLGAVLVPPDSLLISPDSFREYAVQLIRRDPFTREEVRDWIRLVQASVIADPGVEVLYFPTFEQRPVAEANRDWFAAEGIIVDSPGRWATGNTSYSDGWALGRLNYVPGNAIEEAYRTGVLRPDDILLTDGVPAEIPMVAGILTLTPSTPNSHVAILARTYGVPFAYLAVQADADRAWSLIGRAVAVRVGSDPATYLPGSIDIIDAEGKLTDRQTSQLLLLKAPPPLDLAPIAHYGAYWAPADPLLPSDIRYFGGKAANLGLLRTSIPANSPRAIAFSFDLWNDYLDQTVASGKTLRQEIADRLSGYTWPPADMAVVTTELQAVRSLFTDPARTSFSPALQSVILEALTNPANGFDPDRNIRFRSSTNVEDAAQFTGAGLYDSYSGCLADELDSDTLGPSICDPTESSERGVFRAIRKVYASFYNTNAFLERLRHGVDESRVGMAILVHHSFPDEIELANGVATLERSGNLRRIDLVSQLGAVSVANPEGGAIPEHVSVTDYGSPPPYLSLVMSSNLVVLGDRVMDWPDDYYALTDLLIAADIRFAEVAGRDNYILDYEYKKVAPAGTLVVKQIREIPPPDTTTLLTPFLLDAPQEFRVFQGEFGNVFANHRLKSQWYFHTKNLWLTPENMDQCLFNDVATTYAAQGRLQYHQGPLDQWPGAVHRLYTEPAGNRADTVDGWQLSYLTNPGAAELRVEDWPTAVKSPTSPLRFLSDQWNFTLQMNYEHPVPTWDIEEGGWSGGEATTTTLDVVRLVPIAPSTYTELPQARRYDGSNSVTITIRFFWENDGSMFLKTWPLARWEETVIEGLTSRPIVLHGDYSQTYKPEHHNFSEHFLFEPRLEPGIDPALIQELCDQDIRLMHLFFQFDWEPTLTFYGCESETPPSAGWGWMLY